RRHRARLRHPRPGVAAAGLGRQARAAHRAGRGDGARRGGPGHQLRRRHPLPAHRSPAAGGGAMSESLQGVPAPGGAGATGAGPVEAPAGARRRPLNPSLVIGGVIVLVVIALALVSYVWTPWPPMRVLPTEAYQTPNAEHWLGTDRLRRDVFTQILVGARTTLYVGLVAVGVAALVGVPLGILAAMSPG